MDGWLDKCWETWRKQKLKSNILLLAFSVSVTSLVVQELVG